MVEISTSFTLPPSIRRSLRCGEDEDAIVEEQQPAQQEQPQEPHRHSSQQHQHHPPHPRTSFGWGSSASSYNNANTNGPTREHPSDRVKSFVNGIVSPFTACWQPSLNPCVGGGGGGTGSCAPMNCGPHDAAFRKQPAVVISPQTDRTHMTAAEPSHHRDMNCWTSPPQSPEGNHRHNTYPPHPQHHHHGYNHYPHHSYQVIGASTSPNCAAPEDAGASGITAATTTTMKADNIENPGTHDVLCGRGGSSNRHLGNIHFRELVAANKKTYNTLTKKQKMMVARKIVDAVRTTEPPGRFLSKDLNTGFFYDIGLPRSLEKTSQALREKNSNAETSLFPDGEEEGIETTVETHKSVVGSSSSQEAGESPIAGGTSSSSDKPKKSSKNIEAPPLTIPPHLKSVFGPKELPLSSESGEWGADYASPTLRHHGGGGGYHPPHDYHPHTHPHGPYQRSPGGSGMYGPSASSSSHQYSPYPPPTSPPGQKQLASPRYGSEASYASYHNQSPGSSYGYDPRYSNGQHRHYEDAARYHHHQQPYDHRESGFGHGYHPSRAANDTDEKKEVETSRDKTAPLPPSGSPRAERASPVQGQGPHPAAHNYREGSDGGYHQHRPHPYDHRYHSESQHRRRYPPAYSYDSPRGDVASPPYRASGHHHPPPTPTDQQYGARHSYYQQQHPYQPYYHHQPPSPSGPVLYRTPSNGYIRGNSEMSPGRQRELKRQRSNSHSNHSHSFRSSSDASLSSAVRNSLSLNENGGDRESVMKEGSDAGAASVATSATSGASDAITEWATATAASASATPDLQSPSMILQSRVGSRRGMRLPPGKSNTTRDSRGPSATSSPSRAHDDDVDGDEKKEGDLSFSGLSGLAALSTAAFLKLDEVK